MQKVTLFNVFCTILVRLEFDDTNMSENQQLEEHLEAKLGLLTYWQRVWKKNTLERRSLSGEKMGRGSAIGSKLLINITMLPFSCLKKKGRSRGWAWGPQMKIDIWCLIFRPSGSPALNTVIILSGNLSGALPEIIVCEQTSPWHRKLRIYRAKEEACVNIFQKLYILLWCQSHLK